MDEACTSLPSSNQASSAEALRFPVKKVPKLIFPFSRRYRANILSVSPFMPLRGSTSTIWQRAHLPTAVSSMTSARPLIVMCCHSSSGLVTVCFSPVRFFVESPSWQFEDTTMFGRKWSESTTFGRHWLFSIITEFRNDTDCCEISNNDASLQYAYPSVLFASWCRTK